MLDQIRRQVLIAWICSTMAGQYAHIDVNQHLLLPPPAPTATPTADKNEDEEDDHDSEEDGKKYVEEGDNNDIYDQIEIETDNEQDPSNVFVRELNRNETNVNLNKT
ncbi:unnamed protein product [Adineta steineri]|uniref:Uncharacterized protein n=1 Tax=Adineta steineri TaxID=433720 RepID=A0A818WTW6_9BILA|nr:unnamed protein product [Adineta steineri]CAF3730290.1 unnamed protein product [Adineta steineri]